MAQWGNTDDSANSVVWANTTLNVAKTQAELFTNTTVSAIIANAQVGVFGVSPAELDGGSSISSITVTAAGTGYTVRPTVSIGGDGAGATATATAKVVAIAIGDAAGTGYANGDTITVTGGTGTSATATVTTGAADTIPASLTLVTGGSYTVLPSLDEAATTNDGGGDDALKVDLTMGLNTVTVTANGSNYTSAPVTIANTGGSGSGATATAVFTGSERSKVPHAGWTIRTEGRGGRAGRVQYETLVAMSSITGDAGRVVTDPEDDTELPE